MDAPDHNSSNDPAGVEAARPGKSAGEILRSARLERGLSIQDVARQLRLSVRQVTALEDDDYSKLSSATFLRGFVRNYAKLLRVDPSPLLRLIEEALPPPQTQTISYQIEGIPFPSGRNQRKRALIMGGVVILVLSLLVYEIYRGNEVNMEKRQTEAKAEIKDQAEQPLPAVPQSQSPSQTAMNEATEVDVPPTEKAGGPSPRAAETSAVEKRPVTPPPVQQTPAVASATKPVPKTVDVLPPKLERDESSSAPVLSEPADDAGDVLRLSFEGQSWVEVKDSRGKLLLSRINLPGTQQVLRGKPPFSLTIGNAAEVKLIYNNKPVDLARYTNAYGGTARFSLQ